MKRILFLFFCALAISSTQAQDLTGIWRGSFRNSGNSRLMELLGEDDRYKFEVQLDQASRKFSGITYSYLSTVFYGKATCKGTINPGTGKVLLEEIKITEVRMSNMSSACIMTCFLQYSKVGEEEFLEGTYTSMNTRDSSNCGRGTVFLRRVTTSDFYKEPFLVNRDKKKNEPEVKKPDETTTVVPDKAVAKTPPSKTVPKTQPNNKGTSTTKKPAVPPKNTVAKTPPKTITKTLPPVTSLPKTDNTVSKADTLKKIDKVVVPVNVPRVLTTRENELVKTITTSANEIQINIYDNGAVDNDTISVYLDKKLVLSHKRLTEQALTVTFKLNDQNDYHELVMVAENLGEIPPNTSLMVVNAGSKQYEVRITSTEQKNAVVIFKYAKE